VRRNGAAACRVRIARGRGLYNVMLSLLSILVTCMRLTPSRLNLQKKCWRPRIPETLTKPYALCHYLTTLMPRIKSARICSREEHIRARPMACSTRTHTLATRLV
jgi:hypothetical protein